MADFPTVLLVVYVGGIVMALLIVNEPFPSRLGTAAIWPVGAVTFVAVITILLAAVPIAFPRVGLVLAFVAAAAWWIWTSL